MGNLGPNTVKFKLLLTLVCNVVSNWCALLTNSGYVAYGLGLHILGSHLGYVLVFEVLI